MPSCTPASVTVIIVNYNGGDYIGSALDHLRAQTRPPDEVFVIDNASTDGSREVIDLSGLTKAQMIALDENVGFARANNIAAKQANGDWLALLNPDAMPAETWLEELLDATRRHPGVTMFASAQLDASDPSIMDGAGDCYHVLGIPWRGGFGRPAAELPGEGECFSPCGASALFKRTTFIESGGFTESFFCYCEDVDLGFRLRLRGEKCIFVPDALVHHHGSAISGRYSDFTVRLGTRNRLRTYLINMPPVALVTTLPGHCLASLYLYLRAIGKSHARAMRHGFIEGLRGMKQTMRERRRAQKVRKRSSMDMFKIMTWNPVTLHERRADVRQLKTANETTTHEPVGRFEKPRRS